MINAVNLFIEFFGYDNPKNKNYQEQGEQCKESNISLPGPVSIAIESSDQEICSRSTSLSSPSPNDEFETNILPSQIVKNDEAKDTNDNNSSSNPTCTFTYTHHLYHILAITIPIIMSEIFQNTMPVVDLIFVGRLGKDELASANLATVWFNLWNSTMLGFFTAIDTFFAQSYGAKDLDAYAMWAGFSMVVVFFSTMVVAGLCALCEPCMVLFGQDPDIAEAAGDFTYRLLPGLLPYYAFKVSTKYLQAQDLILPGVVIGLLANILNLLTNWLLIFHYGMGINGAPWATTITRSIQFLFMIVYLLWKKKEMLSATWPSLSKMERLTYNAVKPFLVMAFSGMMSLAAESWSFEVTTILAGLIGTVALDGHAVTLNIASFIHLSFPFAVGIATSIRVGHLIGDGKSADARRSCIVAYSINFAVQLLLIATLLPCGRLLADLFSTDDEVADLIANLIPLSCIFMVGDAFQTNTGGIMRGLGRQNLVLLLNILGFWVLAIPIGALLTFTTDLGVFGLWWGFTAGLYSAAFIGVLLLKFRLDWTEETTKAKKRINLDSISASNTMNSAITSSAYESNPVIESLDRREVDITGVNMG